MPDGKANETEPPPRAIICFQISQFSFYDQKLIHISYDSFHLGNAFLMHFTWSNHSIKMKVIHLFLQPKWEKLVSLLEILNSISTKYQTNCVDLL